MKKKEDLRIIKTKTNLYRGLMELMKNKTFEEIKVSEICSQSLINRSTFYDHFTDKYELLQSLIEDLKEELIECLVVNIKSDELKDYYMELIKVLLEHIDNNKEIYSAVVKINSNSIARDMMTYSILDSVSKEIDENFTNSSKIPTKLMVLFYTSGITNVIIESLNDPNNFDKDQLYQIINALIPNQVLLEPKK